MTCNGARREKDNAKELKSIPKSANSNTSRAKEPSASLACSISERIRTNPWPSSLVNHIVMSSCLPNTDARSSRSKS